MPYIILFWLISWLLEGNFKKRFVQQNSLLSCWLLPIYYSLLIIGMFYTENRDEGFFDLEEKLSLLLFPLLIAGVSNIYRKHIHIALLVFVISNVLASFICLGSAFYNTITHAVDESGAGFFYYENLSVFHHPSYFSMYLCFSLCILFYFIEKKIFLSKKKHSFITLALMLIHLVMIYLLSSKAGLIALIVMLLWWSFRFISAYSNKWLSISTFVIIFGIVFYFLSTNYRVKVIWNQIKNTSLESSASGQGDERLLMWMASVEVIKDNFWLGTGTGDVKTELHKVYSSRQLTEATEKYQNVHNQYFETFATIGVFGFILLLTALLYYLISGFFKSNLLLSMLIGIIMINFMFESMLNTQAGVVFIAFFIPLLSNFLSINHKTQNHLLLQT
ncbi:MAG: O-antigen ligase family protein [Bacteroidota bacterium]